jgi:hypothetical protein
MEEITSSKRTLWTKESTAYTEGDEVIVAYIVGDVAHNFVATILKPRTEIMPNNKELVATKIERRRFQDEYPIPEEYQKYVITDEADLETLQDNEYVMEQIVGFDVKMHPFTDNFFIPEALREAALVSLYIPIEHVMRRLKINRDDDPKLPIFNSQHTIDVGRRCRVSRRRLDENGDKHIVRLQGQVVGFQYSSHGMTRNIVKLDKIPSEEELYGIELLDKTQPRYKQYFIAYPDAQFLLLNHHYSIEFAPREVGTYREEYLKVLMKLFPANTVKAKICRIIVSEEVAAKPDFCLAEEHWFGFAKDPDSRKNDGDYYITSGTGNLILGVELNEKGFMRFRVDDETSFTPKVDDTIFGYVTGFKGEGDKRAKRLQWFPAKQYPGYKEFYEFVHTDGQGGIFKGRNTNFCVEAMKHKKQHTIWSQLISGYFTPQLSNDIMRIFKEKYLWYISH